MEAKAPQEGLALAEREHPHVIVLDLEGDAETQAAAYTGFADQSLRTSASLVVLGTVRRSARPRPAHILAKPYHFAPLIHTIEALLAKAAE